MSDDDSSHKATAGPNPILYIFAVGFIGGMFLNMFTEGSDYLSIFLGTAALVLLGVDVGKLTGRR